MSEAIATTAAEKDCAVFVPEEITEAAEPVVREILICPDVPDDVASEEIVEEPASAAVDLSNAIFSLRKVNPGELRTLRRDLREDVRRVEAESEERAVVLGIVVPESFWWLQLRPLLEQYKVQSA